MPTDVMLMKHTSINGPNPFAFYFLIQRGFSRAIQTLPLYISNAKRSRNMNHFQNVYRYPIIKTFIEILQHLKYEIPLVLT
jgi:hypothetical protein